MTKFTPFLKLVPENPFFAKRRTDFDHLCVAQSGHRWTDGVNDFLLRVRGRLFVPPEGHFVANRTNDGNASDRSGRTRPTRDHDTVSQLDFIIANLNKSLLENRRFQDVPPHEIKRNLRLLDNGRDHEYIRVLSLPQPVIAEGLIQGNQSANVAGFPTLPARDQRYFVVLAWNVRFTAGRPTIDLHLGLIEGFSVGGFQNCLLRR